MALLDPPGGIVVIAGCGPITEFERYHAVFGAEAVPGDEGGVQ